MSIGCSGLVSRSTILITSLRRHVGQPIAVSRDQHEIFATRGQRSRECRANA
jgi:hypothetical protein